METRPRVKCHKCRYDLDLRDSPMTGLHCGKTEKYCETAEDNSLIFLSEHCLPGWILAIVEKEAWMKGKLHCPSCGGKIGSFNFVSGRKCGCGKFVLPAVHLVRSQVDTVVDVSRDFTSASHSSSEAVQLRPSV